MLAALESAGLSEGVRCLARRTLSSALTAAERDPSIGLRWNAAKVTKAPAASRKHDAMLPAQAAAILAFARLDRLYALAVLALTTGLRQAECLALRWEDVNLRAGTLQVVHAKTRAGVREVPLSPQLVDALKAHQAAQRAERMAATEWFDTGLVFTTTAGTALTASIATKWWHRQTRGAGLGTRRFHAARHTAATMMLNHGADLATVSRILGHSSIAVTADIYARPDARKLRAGADAVAAALAGAA
jgi:integrase